MVSGKTYRLIAVVDLQQDAELSHKLMLMIYAQQPTTVRPLGFVRINHLKLAFALADLIYPCPRRGPRSRLDVSRVLRFLGLKAIQIRNQGNMIYSLTARFTRRDQDYRIMFNL